MLRQIVCTSGRLGRQTIRHHVVKRNNSTVAAVQAFQDEFDKAKPYESMPGPKPLPIIGNVWRFLPYIVSLSTDYTVQQDVFYRTYGNIVRLTGLPGKRDMVMIFDPDDIEKVKYVNMDLIKHSPLALVLGNLQKTYVFPGLMV